MAPIEKGYVYSMGGGILLFKDMRFYKLNKKETVLAYHFTVVQRMDEITRNVKPWDKYVLNRDRHSGCISFTIEVFSLLKYEPALTVLYGN